LEIRNTGYDIHGNVKDPMKQFEPGVSHGLSLRLFVGNLVNELKNFFNIQETYGLTISINNQSNIPLTSENMMRLQAGTCTYINLRKTVAQNLPAPYSNCKDLEIFDSIYKDEFVKYDLTVRLNLNVT
jgi:hypothetical protein